MIPYNSVAYLRELRVHQTARAAVRPRPSVEQLENRRLLSVTLTAASHAGGNGQLTVPSYFISEPGKSASINAPASMLGSYQGFYNIYPDTGNVTMVVSAVKKNTFSGSLQFLSNDGTSVTGTYKATVSRGLNFRFNLKAGKNTAISCSGGYQDNGYLSMMTITVKGTRFGGVKLNHFVPGEFVVTAFD